MASALPLAALLAALPVHDPGPGEAPTHADEAQTNEIQGRRFVLAVKIVAGTSRAADATTPLFGPGLDLEMELWRHGLEVELAGAALLGDGVTSVPTELLLKKSFPVEENMELFAAAGGILNLVSRPGHGLEAVPGGIVLVGAYVWHGDHFGVLIELSYAMLSEAGDLEHDVEGAVGVAYRF